MKTTNVYGGGERETLKGIEKKNFIGKSWTKRSKKRKHLSLFMFRLRVEYRIIGMGSTVSGRREASGGDPIWKKNSF